MERGNLPPFSFHDHPDSPGCNNMPSASSQQQSYQATQDRMKITSLLQNDDLEVPPPILPKNDFKCLPFFNHLLQDSPSTPPNFVFPPRASNSNNVSPFSPSLVPDWAVHPYQQMNMEPQPIADPLSSLKRKSEDSGDDTDSKKHQKSDRMFKVPKNRPKNGAFERQWMEHYEQLKQFKELYGHTNVTRSTKGYGNLGNWLAEQRRKLRRGKLIQKQYEMLDALGVEWDRSHYFLPKVYAEEQQSTTP